MKTGQTLTLTGTADAALLVGGNLSAGADRGNLFITATEGSHSIATGAGSDTINDFLGGRR